MALAQASRAEQTGLSAGRKRARAQQFRTTKTERCEMTKAGEDVVWHLNGPKFLSRNLFLVLTF